MSSSSAAAVVVGRACVPAAPVWASSCCASEDAEFRRQFATVRVIAAQETLKYRPRLQSSSSGRVPHLVMKLEEQYVLAKTKAASLADVRNLNLWGNGLTDVSVCDS